MKHASYWRKRLHPFRPECEGATPGHLKVLLNHLGLLDQFEPGYGPAVSQAVRDFQASAGLEVNGLVDQATVDALIERVEQWGHRRQGGADEPR
ncbi:peptidoglycan-binding domain-containing protein [Pseudomonas sp. 21LCFQ010]|uniref:peptidoglycan-binding domain-containing protein n=1 Tax=Pseudomonas sp. 21LCFQ010 TaxID=2957506 RepID=UPI00345293B8